ncbi:MAG TPA: alpha/beta fold hydrolase [Candidatus Limnocylindrales bacterium]
MRFRVLALTGALFVAACSATSRTPGSSPDAGLSASPSLVADVVVGGDRPVTVHVPPGYDPARPAPLLIVLHGYGSDGQSHDAYLHLGKLAEERGFLYAYPDGTKDAVGNRFWNATDACCNFDRIDVDDAAYLDGVITETEAMLSVDPKRIDLVGHSNGGFMSYRYACAHADRVAAVISLAGATFGNAADCAPVAPVAVLQIHGTADDTVGYYGGSLSGLGSGRPVSPYPGAEATVATWSRYDGCDAAPVATGEHVDVDADISSGVDPAEATIARSSGCKPGGAVELWTIPGGGHAPNLSDAFPTATLDFLVAHPKP